MADVKWIKITTDIFDDEKILMIESLPSADSIIVIWFKLLSFAGKQNNNGVFLMSNRIAYTDEMLASIFRRDVNTIRLALNAFEQYGMIEIVNNVITIPNWSKHQSLDAYEKRKERDRLYQAKKRAEQRALATKSADESSDTSSDIALLEEDKEKEEEKELEIDIIPSGVTPPPQDSKNDCEQIINLFHTICKSFPQVRKLTDARKQAIRTRLRKYSVEDFRTVFENAEESAFLRGDNGGWKASFDWLIKEANMVKVLEGNYTDKPKRYGWKEKVPGWMGFSPGDAEIDAIQKMMNDDPETQKEREQLEKELQQSFGRKECG